MRSVLLTLTILAASAVYADDGDAKSKQKPKTVTLDVKDGDVRVVLKALKDQCGIKNMIIDRDVAGAATFYLRDVPCETAFKVVFRTMGLAAQMEPNSVVLVGAGRSR